MFGGSEVKVRVSVRWRWAVKDTEKMTKSPAETTRNLGRYEVAVIISVWFLFGFEWWFVLYK